MNNVQTTIATTRQRQGWIHEYESIWTRGYLQSIEPLLDDINVAPTQTHSHTLTNICIDDKNA